MKEIPISALGFTQRQLRLHVNGFQSRFGFVARRANIDADPAAGAIFHRDLQRVFQPFQSGSRDSVELNDEGAPERRAAS